MAQDLPLESSLDLAIRRLDQALSTLEARLAAHAAQRAEDDNGDLFAAASFDEDRARLAAELDSARAREKALEEVAAEASAALGRAAAEVRAALAAGES
jgi:predicted  nucleic acid-binding Zn-ribbon protein